MDPCPQQKSQGMPLISECGLPVSYHIYSAPDGEFMVLEFIEGDLVEQKSPPGVRIVEKIKADIVNFYTQMVYLHLDPAQILDAKWLRHGLPLTFLEKPLETAWLIFEPARASHALIFEFLDMPQDPFTSFSEKGTSRSKRPWQLFHADLHRGDLIEDPNGQTHSIDRKRSLYRDILCCVVVHLHRMRYFRDEQQERPNKIDQILPSGFRINYEHDLNFHDLR